MISDSWLMKRHVDQHLRDGMHVDDQNVLEHVHGDGNNVAGNMHGNFRTKKGSDPKSIIRNMANFIDIKIKLGELSDDNVYVIVEFDGEIFITTIR